MTQQLQLIHVVAERLNMNPATLRRRGLSRGLLTQKQGRMWLVDEANVPALLVEPRRYVDRPKHRNQAWNGVKSFTPVSIYTWESILKQLEEGRVRQEWVAKGYGGRRYKKCKKVGCKYDLYAFPIHDRGLCMHCLTQVLPE